MKVTVLGAGVTGLTAALALRRRGHDVMLYEASSEAGGLASSVKIEDHVFDYGPHEFITNNVDLVAFLKEVLDGDLLERQKSAAQHVFGRYVPYPAKPVDLITSLPPALTLKILAEVTTKKFQSLVRAPADYSFRSWVVNRFGKTLYARYFEPYTRKVWGLNPDLLDPRTASSRIAFDSAFDLAWQTLTHAVAGVQNFRNTHNPMRDGFYYTRGGIGTLTRALAGAAAAAGVTIHTNHRVTRLDRRGDGPVNSITFETGNTCEDPGTVVSTLPLPLICDLLGQPRPQLGFRGMTFVFMRIPHEARRDFQWIYTPDPEIPFQRVTNFAIFDADLCPPGSTGLCLEIACFPEDAVWTESSESLGRRCLQALERLDLIDTSGAQWDVRRFPAAYPLQTIGFLEAAGAALDRLSTIPRFWTLGRQGQFKYINMNECMELALDACSGIEQGRAPVYSLATKWRSAGRDLERTVTDAPPSPGA